LGDLWDKTKSKVDDVAKYIASSVTSYALTQAFFSMWDIAFPGLGTAIGIGISYASTWAVDKAADQIDNAINDNGSSLKTSVGLNSRGHALYNQIGNSTFGITFDGSGPFVNYSQTYGSNYDYKSAYYANIVSQGHKCESALYEALNKIYSGVKKAIVAGAKSGTYSLRRTANELAHNEQLHNGVKFGFAAAMVVKWEATKYAATDALVALTNYTIPYPDEAATAVLGFLIGKNASALTMFPFGLETHRNTGIRTSQRIQRIKRYFYE
jgi:hypothetical protein